MVSYEILRFSVGLRHQFAQWLVLSSVLMCSATHHTYLLVMKNFICALVYLLVSLFISFVLSVIFSCYDLLFERV